MGVSLDHLQNTNCITASNFATFTKQIIIVAYSALTADLHHYIMGAADQPVVPVTTADNIS